MAAIFQMTGVPELDRKFAALEAKAQKKIVRRPLRDAAKLIYARAMAIGPRPDQKRWWKNVKNARSTRAITAADKGLLLSSLKVRSGRIRNGRVSVNVITAAGWFKGPAFYAPFVILGHRIGKRPSKGRSQGRDTRGKVPGNNFLKRARDQTQGPALAVARAGIAQAIEEAAGQP